MNTPFNIQRTEPTGQDPQLALNKDPAPQKSPVVSPLAIIGADFLKHQQEQPDAQYVDYVHRQGFAVSNKDKAGLDKGLPPMPQTMRRADFDAVRERTSSNAEIANKPKPPESQAPASHEKALAKTDAAGSPYSLFSGPAANGHFGNKFLTNDADNPLATVLQTPGMVVGRLGLVPYANYINEPITRNAGQTGLSPGHTHYEEGQVSVLSIDNYSADFTNTAAAGGTAGFKINRHAGDTQDNFETIVKPEAQSLTADSMFARQSNHLGQPDETVRGEVLVKGLVSVGNVNEVKTDGPYEGLNKKSVTVNALHASAGIGAFEEWDNPLKPGTKLGVEASLIGAVVLNESKQMSAAGVVANQETGIYGAALGFETRNRLAAIELTANQGADIGIANAKLSEQVFAAFGTPILGGGMTAHAVWNDKTGTATLQMTDSAAVLGVGLGMDVSGEFQTDYGKDIVKNTISLVKTVEARIEIVKDAVPIVKQASDMVDEGVEVAKKLLPTAEPPIR